MSGYKERKIIKWGSGLGVDISSLTNKSTTNEYYAQNTGSDQNNVKKDDLCFIRKLSYTEVEGKNICPIPQPFLDNWRRWKIGDIVEVFVDEDKKEVLINKKDKQKEFEEIKKRIEKGKEVHVQEEIQSKSKIKA